MILKKYYSLFFLIFIFFSSFNMYVSNGFASKNSATCEITNTYINCFNISYSEVMKIKLFNDPYRMQIKFKNKLIIKRNKIKNSRFIKSVKCSSINYDSS